MFFKQAKDYPDLLDKKALAAFLKPVSKAEPSGKSLRYEQEYDDIQLARKSEEDLPQGVWAHDLKESQWDKAEEICVGALQTKSKDLQLSLWLTECWYHEYQAYGLKNGLNLTKQLLENFWDSFHPFSKDDPEYRVVPLLWFDKELSKALTQLIIALPEGDPQRALTFWDYQSKVLITPPNQQKSVAGAHKNKMSSEAVAFYGAVKQTSTEFYGSLIDEVSDSLVLIKDIEKLIEKNYKEFPGCLMHLRGRLEKILHFTKNIYQERSSGATQSDAEVVDIKSDKKNQPTNTLSMSAPMIIKNLTVEGTLQNRQQAYELLSQIADYLAEIEPHSPTPYLIRRAVSWGDMSLGELMTELAQQSGGLQNAMHLLGMNEQE